MSKKLKVLDLFSGIGGFSLGLESTGGFETMAFCEIDEFCHKVLNKNFPYTQIFTNIKTLTKDKLDELGPIDIVCGGFPCQPFSIAGRKKSTEDDRDLWPEMFRVIKETRPAWVIGENVANFINLAFTRTKVDLESIGYSVQPFAIPACAIGAQHRRDRVWIIAHTKSVRDRGECGEFPKEKTGTVSEESRLELECSHENISGEESLSHINSNGFGRKANASKKKNNEGVWQDNWWTKTSADFGNWWADKPGVGRVVHGFSRELDKYRRARVKALGNAIVPGIVAIIGKAILEASEQD